MLGANIDYINDSISDCQATIMQIEETKVCDWTGPSIPGSKGILGHSQAGHPGVLWAMCHTLGGAAPTQSLVLRGLPVECSWVLVCPWTGCWCPVPPSLWD